MDTNINGQHALNEIINNVKKHDLIKARLVIDHMDHVDKEIQKKMLNEINKAKPEVAIPLLAYLIVKYKDIAGEFPGLRNTLYENVIQQPEFLVNLIEDRAREIEIYIELAGDFQLQESVPVLIDILEEGDKDEIIIRSIKALGEIGDQIATSAISKYLNYDNKEVVLTAIKALGEIATPSAIQRLTETLGREEQLDLFILDIFAKVQDNISIQKLNEAIQSNSAFLRNYAREKLVDIGPKAVPILCDNLHYKDSNLQIMSLEILGEIGDESAVNPIRKLLSSHVEDPNIRFSAYEALMKIPSQQGNYVLSKGLRDPGENVRVAAARAINFKYNDLLSAGVKNMIKENTSESEKIIEAILIAQADNMFSDLLEVDKFRSYAIKYFSNRASEELIEFYVNILEEEGKFSELRQRLTKIYKTKKGGEVPLVCAVDDSELILRIYRKVLNGLDYKSQLFQEPTKALEWIKENHPSVLCTDLNMPELTGIELTQEVRDQYSTTELPIILVTSQDDSPDKNSAFRAGVNEFLHKPFNEENLGNKIQKVIKN